MIYSYDPLLVFISILVATVGAYACFDLVVKIRKSDQDIDKSLLAIAAFTIGGSIWSMHFVAMQALNLSISVSYDILPTIISGLISVLMTAVALLIVSSHRYSPARLLCAGVIMGSGISAMHYVGMSAIQSNCRIDYDLVWVFLSVVVGILASTISLWSVLRLRGLARRLIAAIVLGISISGVHYIGMIGTSFIALDVAISVSQPILSPLGIGLATAISTFVIIGGMILSLVPSGPGIEGAENKADTVINIERVSSAPEASEKLTESALVEDGQLTARDNSENESNDAELEKLAVREGRDVLMIDYSDILSICADGHYTTVFTSDGKSLFCNYPISHVEETLKKSTFLRVHRSHIANLKYVEAFQRKVDKGVILMRAGQHKVPVSKLNIAELQRGLKIQ